MVRKIIKIDEDKCVGCGLCANACHEGAIAIVDGKAKLLRDDYCDGLGNCLPVCPTKAITFEEREAENYNKAVAPKRIAAKSENLPCGCPGTQSKALNRENGGHSGHGYGEHGGHGHGPRGHGGHGVEAQVPETQLNQWPVQIKLVPVNAPYFENANLLVAADCTAYAYGNFHSEFMRNKITLIGCPKLDEGDYSEKLTAILAENNIKSVTVVRMEVPCCGGIENAVKAALKDCGKLIQWQVVTISTDGRILDN